MTTTKIAAKTQLIQLANEARNAGDDLQVELCEAAQHNASELDEYARGTAADMGGSYAAAVRAMRDESTEVAANVGCSVEVVEAWIKCATAIIEQPEA